MAFDDTHYLEIIEQDTVLIEALRRNKKRLTYARGRITEHLALQTEVADAVERQSAKKAAAAEAKRSPFVNQTRFLLMAQFVKDLSQVDEFFPPPEG